VNVLYVFPRIDPRFVLAVNIGLEQSPMLKINIRNDKVQLKPSFIPVLNPCKADPINLQPCGNRLFKAVHDFVFLLNR
jgi:hypothetical protein